ncbi:FecR family protein [Chryseosolibacter indicus]|uniref:FecR domain-containing protein n=1 Tax=Chryseosolibacter indicus TaxID=2782351 RepID=A0ABS5VSP9_9BACT|nr:FecR domain-containing protein [Chryseosolibacter indicus]MBT1704454.1 FecR domain-containing protein [Chryseosolibacter indicus]
MGNTKYDDLMKRWLTNQVTETERIKIEAWLDSIDEGDADDLEMTDQEAEEIFNRITSNSDNIREIRSFKPESIRKKNRPRWILQIAASLFLVAVATYTIWTIADPPVAAIKKITLNDGSLVWVRGDSKLSYSESAEGRFADLDGEALFEVAKDPTRPFTIRYKDVNARVVGTSFSLKTGDSLQLVVLTGTVNLSSAADKEGLNILMNEKAIYTAHSGIKKFSLLQNEAQAVIADTEYNMNFTNATFDEVIEKIERKFDVRITLSDNSIGECHLNLDITDHSLESSLQMITSVLNVAYLINGDQIIFTGTGCK